MFQSTSVIGASRSTSVRCRVFWTRTLMESTDAFFLKASVNSLNNNTRLQLNFTHASIFFHSMKNFSETLDSSSRSAVTPRSLMGRTTHL
uniref:Uncharacterized protein n=1 Tax=Diadromus pulchellus ascovirus 4a TaxID=158683 RepID=Q9DST2_9VIRU|nr:hypothetical protein [Diadromus pulchellus ascovirus 4a]